MISGTTLQQSIRPAQPPIDLEAARLTAKETLARGGIALASLLVSAIAALIAVSCYDQYQMSAVRWVGVAAGGAVVAVGISFGYNIHRRTMQAMLDHERRVEDWHQAALDAWSLANGQQVDQSMTEWTLRADQPRDVLLAAILIAIRIQRGDDRPWSVRKLAGPHYLDSGQNSLLIGELTAGEAERMSAQLGRLGLIRGREEKKAGDWVPRSIDETISTLLKNWSRV